MTVEELKEYYDLDVLNVSLNGGHIHSRRALSDEEWDDLNIHLANILNQQVAPL